jgi:hypothetical protein
MGPCAKQTVRCVIWLANGEAVAATNACLNPQPKCPREPGEGYEKCKTICQQLGHAEVQAVQLAARIGADLKGSRAVITGHTYACQHCQETLAKAGCNTFTLGGAL